MRNRCRITMAMLLTILFIGYWCCTTMFMHVHYIDGVRIVHSHPYTDTASSHAHSGSQLQTISYLSALLAVVSFAGAALVLTSLRLHRLLRDEHRAASVLSLHCPLRAPPVC